MSRPKLGQQVKEPLSTGGYGVTENTQKEWLTVSELYAWLPLGRTKVYALLQSEIPNYRVGRKIMVRRQDVEAWLEKNHYRPGT
jgi:excisionase family DNA binding protein